MMRRFVLACFAALALAGCDAFPAPEGSPHDPLSDSRATPYYASDLAITATSGTEITMTWTDRSAFERGYSIERSDRSLDDRQRVVYGPYREVAEVPADAEVFTDTNLQGTAGVRYRVRPTGGSSWGSRPVGAELRFEEDVYDLPDGRVAGVMNGGFVLFDIVGIRARTLSFMNSSLRTSVHSRALLGDDYSYEIQDTCYGAYASDSGFAFYDHRYVPILERDGVGEIEFGISGDCRRLALASLQGPVEIVEVATGAVLASFDDLSGPLALNEDGSVLYSSSPTGGRIQARGVATGQLLWEHLENAALLLITDDGTLLFQKNDGPSRVRTLHPMTGEVLGTTANSETFRGAVAGGYVVTVREETTRLHRLPDLSLVRTLPEVGSLVERNSEVQVVTGDSAMPVDQAWEVVSPASQDLDPPGGS